MLNVTSISGANNFAPTTTICRSGSLNFTTFWSQHKSTWLPFWEIFGKRIVQVKVKVMKHHCYVNHWAQPETEKTHILGHGHAQTENQQHSNSKQRQQQAEATPVVCISCRKASAHRKLSPRRSRHSWKCACTCSSFFVLLLLLFFFVFKKHNVAVAP